MKKVIIYLFALIALNTNAQDSKYVSIMEKVISQLDSAKDISAFQNNSNTLERIAIANPTEWLPGYYQSYCFVMMGMRQESNSKKDEFYDKAELLINKADSISPNNSEIYVMKAWIMSMKISVDPASRGQKYGMQSAMFNSKAVELDKENPRAYFMKGQGTMYTPEQFGGGAAKALPILEQAVAKYKTFKPSSSIMPRWGEPQAIQALERCKNQIQNGK